jgi:hypothetical protein
MQILCKSSFKDEKVIYHSIEELKFSELPPRFKFALLLTSLIFGNNSVSFILNFIYKTGIVIVYLRFWGGINEII